MGVCYTRIVEVKFHFHLSHQERDMNERQKLWAKIVKQLRGAVGCLTAAHATWPDRNDRYTLWQVWKATKLTAAALEAAQFYVDHIEIIDEPSVLDALDNQMKQENGQS